MDKECAELFAACGGAHRQKQQLDWQFWLQGEYLHCPHCFPTAHTFPTASPMPSLLPIALTASPFSHCFPTALTASPPPPFVLSNHSIRTDSLFMYLSYLAQHSAAVTTGVDSSCAYLTCVMPTWLV